MYINNALANVLPLGDEVKEELNKCLKKHRKLFEHLKLSTKLKYKIEWILFIIYNKRYTDIYRVIKRLS